MCNMIALTEAGNCITTIDANTNRVFKCFWMKNTSINDHLFLHLKKVCIKLYKIHFTDFRSVLVRSA